MEGFAMPTDPLPSLHLDSASERRRQRQMQVRGSERRYLFLLVVVVLSLSSRTALGAEFVIIEPNEPDRGTHASLSTLNAAAGPSQSPTLTPTTPTSIAEPPRRSTESPIYYSEDNTQRIGHVTCSWPLTEETENGRRFTPFWVDYAAAYLAMEQFNARSGAVISELPALLEGCDFRMTMDVRDDQLNKVRAIQGLMEAFYPEDARKNPFAILGSFSSGVSQPMSIMADAFQIPQMSGSATSKFLEQSHHFTRTIPTNQGEAAAAMVYFQSIGVTRIGIAYVSDSFGKGFHDDLFDEAQKFGITVGMSMPYGDEQDASIEASMRLLKQSDLRYIILISNSFYFKPVLRAAHAEGIVGGSSGRQWYMAEYQYFLNDDFTLQEESESDIAEALHGMGVIHLNHQRNEGFEREFKKLALGGTQQHTNETELYRTEIQQGFVKSVVESELFDGYEFKAMQSNVFTYLIYDAVMAYGIAACRTPGQFQTEEFLEVLLQSEFYGITGWVALDKNTGTRLARDLPYRLDNVILSTAESKDGTLHFDSFTSAMIQGPNITNLAPFVFADNTTISPPDIPPLSEHNYNLVPTWAHAVGWTLGGLSLFLSVVCATWTIYNREQYVVRVSQPIFLCQLCLGCFLMALAILPLSMQEQVQGDGTIDSPWDLDAACMAMPWLFYTGFALTASAILSKTLRLNKLISHSKSMRRIVVRHRDVLLPLVVLVGSTVALLLACNLVTPFTWHRVFVEHQVDKFGRSLESFGTCQHTRAPAPDTDMTTYYFIVPIVIINFGGVAVATYQCYLARDLPTEMTEARYLFAAIISLLEVFIIGGPLLFLPSASPTVYYLIMTSVISLACFASLLPIFLPKYRLHRSRVNERSSGRNHPFDYRASVQRSTGPVQSRPAASIRLSAQSGSGNSLRTSAQTRSGDFLMVSAQRSGDSTCIDGSDTNHEGGLLLSAREKRSEWGKMSIVRRSDTSESHRTKPVQGRPSASFRFSAQSGAGN